VHSFGVSGLTGIGQTSNQTALVTIASGTVGNPQTVLRNTLSFSTAQIGTSSNRSKSPFDQLGTLTFTPAIEGHWWATFGRILLLILIFIVAGVVVVAPFMLLLGKVGGSIFYGAFILFITPFAVAYQYEIFNNFRRLKPDVAERATKSDSSFVKVAMVVGIVGAVLIAILIVAAIAFFGPSFMQSFGTHNNCSCWDSVDRTCLPAAACADGGSGFNPGGPLLPVQPQPQSQPLE
jgi:hypothetical protein